MSSGKEHKQAQTIVFIPLVVVLAIVFVMGYRIYSVLIAFGYIVGYILEPDLDQVGVTRSDAALLRKWYLLPITAPIFMHFTVYAVIMRNFGGHRSFWSHFPVVSTVIRWVWLIAPLYLIARYFNLQTNIPTDMAIAVIAGTSISDTIHWAMDGYGHKSPLKRTKS